VKTISKPELVTLLEMLPKYKQHFLSNPNSLLAKIFGAFTVRKAGMGLVHVMLMDNTMKIKNPKLLKHVFDLKGSTYNRKTECMEINPSTVLKDLDFLKVKKRRP
jgi:hypothetical protein